MKNVYFVVLLFVKSLVTLLVARTGWLGFPDTIQVCRSLIDF